MKIKKSPLDTLFTICNTLLMLLLAVIAIYPLWFVAVASISDAAAVSASKGLLLWPANVNFAAYQAVMENPNIKSGYLNTLFYLVAGTTLNLAFTTVLAYGLSRKKVLWANTIMKLIVFTMFFSGGMIPSYMLVKGLHMVGTIWALLIPNLISTYNMIIMRTAFLSIPASMEESAKLDGANEFQVMARIVIPLSIPTMAVMVLYYGVGHWNSWFNASLYLNKRSMYPLQLILREILVINTMDSMTVDTGAIERLSVEQTIKYATIMVATIPILCIYPFLQKHFVKGVMIGAIKE